ncbi:MAG: hypothetical protein HUJ30_02470 [Gammaproteobacteria bacterium]|nr:hypothetical protein [Gammaproteobacteria bacterium]
MVDWVNPSNATQHLNVIPELEAKIDAIALMDPGTFTNLPTGWLRFDDTAKKAQRWNGTAWADVSWLNQGVGTGDSPTFNVVSMANGSRIIGTTTGVGNLSHLRFEDSAGTRTGFVGEGSGTSNNIFLTADAGDIQLFPQIGGKIYNARSGGEVIDTGNDSTTCDAYTLQSRLSTDFYHNDSVVSGGLDAIFTKSGAYLSDQSPLNAPNATSQRWTIHQYKQSSYGNQIAIESPSSGDTRNMYYRAWDATNGFTSWKQVITTENDSTTCDAYSVAGKTYTVKTWSPGSIAAGDLAYLDVPSNAVIPTGVTTGEATYSGILSWPSAEDTTSAVHAYTAHNAGFTATGCRLYVSNRSPVSVNPTVTYLEIL